MSRFAGAALVLLVGGCALATATSPHIGVASVELRSAGLLDQSLDVTLCIYNPNADELAFRRIDVGLDVAGSSLADSVSETAVRLPARQSVLVPFAVATTTRNLIPQLAGILDRGAVPYRLHGSVQLAGSLGLTIPFSRSGLLGPATAGQALLTDLAEPVGNGCADSG